MRQHASKATILFLTDIILFSNISALQAVEKPCKHNLQDARLVTEEYMRLSSLTASIVLKVGRVPQKAFAKIDQITDQNGFRYFITLSPRYICECSEAQLRRTLAHELGHLIRGDIGVFKWETADESSQSLIQRRANQFALRLIGEELYKKARHDEGQAQWQIDQEVEELQTHYFGRSIAIRIKSLTKNK